MTAITTNKIGKAIAEAMYDDVLSRRGKYYFYFGKTSEFEVGLDTPLATIEYEKYIRNNMIMAKRILPSDVSFVIRRFDWVSGTTYVPVSETFDGNVTISGPKFYVLDPLNFRVYKCLNSTGNPSTVRPTLTSVEPFTTSDGYTWKYMYFIPVSLRNKFLTVDYMPVFTGLQARYYSDGGIDKLAILNPGDGYIQANTIITVLGDGEGALLEPVIRDGKLGEIIIINPGRNYTAARIVVTRTDIPATVDAEVYPEISIGDLSTDQALVELLTTPGTIDRVEVLTGGSGYVTATVKIEGDGTGAEAVAVITGGVITKIDITNSGQGYSNATAIITGQVNPSPPTSNATTKIHVSPHLGNSRNAIEELFSTALMFYGTIYTEKLQGFDVTNDFRQFGVIKNPRNFDFSLNIHDQFNKNQYLVTGDFGPLIVFSGGGGKGAKGRVNIIGNTVDAIKVKDKGQDYTSEPTVVISGPGTGASAKAILDTVLANAIITYDGVGYASTPFVELSGGEGKDGVISASITRGIGCIEITDGGSNYTSAPTVGFVGGDGTGASAVAEISNGSVVKVVITDPGSGYNVLPTVTFTGGGGTDAAGTPKVSFVLDQLTIDNDGENYKSSPTLSIIGSTGISDVEISDIGTGYSSAPTIAFTGGGGSGATAQAVINSGVRTITVTNQGFGYTSAPTVTIASPGGLGTQATAIANLSAGKVISITITNFGSGYSSDPGVSFTGGGGTDAAATASIATGVTHINITNPGIGYTSAPTVTLTGGGGSETKAGAIRGIATGTVGITGVVNSIEILNGGSGYTTVPTITFTGGGGGTGAEAVAKVTGYIGSITVDSGGSGYSTAPTALISGGEGINGEVRANITGDEVTSVTVTNPGSKYVITQFADFPAGQVLSDTGGNEFTIIWSLSNGQEHALIVESNSGTSIVSANTTLERIDTFASFIVSQARSHKLIESIKPSLCYKVSGSFNRTDFPDDTTVVATDQTNGNKYFTVIATKQGEMLLAPTNGGVINIGMTLSKQVGETITNPFAVTAVAKPEMDRRTGQILTVDNRTDAFAQDRDQTLSFRTIVDF